MLALGGVLAALGAGAPVQARPATLAPPLYVYVGAACDGAAVLPRLRSFLGRQEDGVVEFDDYRGDWRRAQGALDYGLGCWRGAGVRNIAISLPMVVDAGGGLGDDQSAQFAAFGRALVQHGFPAAYVRIGWEFNGDWYRWSAAPGVGAPDPRRPAVWIAAFRRDAKAVRSTCPGCRIVWNPALYRQKIAPDEVYPGDEVVDVIGVDAYNAPRFPSPSPAINWAQTYGPFSDWGVARFVEFAAAHHKPLAYPEWGTPADKSGKSPDEDAYFISHMAQLMARTPTAFQGWWDFNGGQVESDVSGGRAPAAEIAFQQAFGTARVPALLAGARLYHGPLTATVDGSDVVSVLAEGAGGDAILLIWGGHDGQSAQVRLSQPRSAVRLDPTNGSRRILARGLQFSVGYSSALQLISLSER